MRHALKDSVACESNIHLLLTYVADLELEVDRLRKQSQLVQHEARSTLNRVQVLCTDAAQGGNTLPPLPEIQRVAKQLAEVLRDLQEPPGYHPAHDQVVAIAVRPLVEQVFRWQQRVCAAPDVVLRLELGSEHLEWFPARLRHILDNLISNALKYRSREPGQAWVRLSLTVTPASYELEIADNGVGLPPSESTDGFQLFYRSAPALEAGLGVGLAVVKSLVEQSGGSLTVTSHPDQGTTFALALPRYDVDDFLT